MSSAVVPLVHRLLIVFSSSCARLVFRQRNHVGGFRLPLPCGAVLIPALFPLFYPGAAPAQETAPSWQLTGRIVAIGLPGVTGVREVGRFHFGGPIPGNPDFLLATRDDRVLGPTRVLVAVRSNLGATPSDRTKIPGAIISIDPHGSGDGKPVVVPEDLARLDQHAGAAAQLYSAQSDAYRNDFNNSSALTARLTGVAGPRYISINDAFGRPWIANAPDGLSGPGTITVLDPDGVPLANPPSADAGGVFAGWETNRREVPIGRPDTWLGKLLNYRKSGQLTPGALTTGALGTAFLGASPDGTGFAVFAAVTADGALVQIHVQDGVDGLADPGTIKVSRSAGDDPGVVGMAFNWTPNRILYVVDPGGNTLDAFELSDDARQFRITKRRTIALDAFDHPVDIAPTTAEVANPLFSSLTTLSGGSDVYVANRGNGTILRLDQDGRLLARAQITIPNAGAIGADRLQAIATSADGQHIWATITGTIQGFPGQDGALIELPAFDGDGVFGAKTPPQDILTEKALVSQGKADFETEYTAKTGLGQLFNAPSCAACHPGPGGASTDATHYARRIAHMDPATGRVELLVQGTSPVARRFMRQGGETMKAPLPRDANIISLRAPPLLFGIARIDEIPDSVIAAQAVAKGDGIKGHPNYVIDTEGKTRIGRYGWKADKATLSDMVTSALAIEIGDAVRPIQDGPSDVVAAMTAFLHQMMPEGEGKP